MEWNDASTATYTAESTMVGKFTVTVCLDDEGPLRPAYYWCITETDPKVIVTDGWAGTVAQAREDALAQARQEVLS